MASVGVIFYTDNQLDEKIARACRDQLRKAFSGQIVTASLKPLDFGDKQIVLPLERGHLTMFKQILAALEASTADIIFHCEHDVLYHPSHFEFRPSEVKFYYNQNWWKVRKDGLAVHWDADQVSGLCAPRQLLLDFYRHRVASFDKDNFDRKYEPMSGTGSEAWKAEYPDVDIRHNSNWTLDKWSLDDFRSKDTAKNFQTSRVDDIPGWDNLRSLLD